MASFTPSIQAENAPSYIGLSKPLSKYDVNVDRESAVTIAGIGDVFKDAVTGTDNTFKAVIDNALENKVDQTRSQTTGALEEVAGIPQSNRIGTPTDSPYPAPAGGGSLTSQPTQAPQAVDAGLQRAAVLSNASQTGKINPSYYESQLNTIAQSLRSQYPGYRDYIDEKISQMTGGNPANKYIQELYQTINQNIGNAKSDRDKALEYLGKSEFSNMPGHAALVTAIAQGQVPTPLAEAVRQGAAWNAPMEDIKRRASQLSDLKGGIEEQRVQMEPLFGQLASHVVDQTITNTLQNMQLNGHNLNDIIEGVRAGKINLSAQEELQLQQAIHSLRDRASTQIDQEAGKVLYPGVPTLKQTLAVDVYNQRKAQALSNLDTMVKAVDDKDYGLVGRVSNQSKAIIADTSLLFLNAEGSNNADMVRKMARVSAVANNLFGPNAGPWVQKMVGTPQYSTSLMNYVQHMGTKLIIGDQDPQSPQAFTLSQALGNLQKGNVGIPDPNAAPGSGLSNPNSPVKRGERGAYMDTISIPGKAVADPNLPDAAKANAIKGSYGSNNTNVLGFFSPDSLDDKGNLKGGQHKAYATMTTPAITQKAFELGQSDPKAWAVYRGWVEDNAQKLIAGNAADLSKYATDANVKLDYNPNTHEFTVKADKPGMQPGHFSGDYINGPFQFKVAQMNTVLKSLSEVGKKVGEDPNEYIKRAFGNTNAESTLINTINKAAGKDTDQTPELDSYKEAKASLDAGSDKFQHAVSFFQGKGYSPEQAAGIVGGLSGETPNLNTDQVHDNGIGYGIAGWNGPRLINLINKAKEMGKPVSDLDVQLEHVASELDSSEGNAKAAILNSKTPEESAGAFTKMFERPNSKVANVQGRSTNARVFYNKFFGSKVASK